MLQKHLTVVLVVAILRRGSPCGSFGGSNDDARIFTNPTLSWSMSPPAAWTFPVSYALITQQFFPSQSLTQATATTKAQGDIQSAVIFALSEVNVPTNGVKVTTGYNPQEVSGCIKVAPTATGSGIPALTTAGTIFGIEEQGAITKLATPAADIPVASCAAQQYATYTTTDYIQQATAQIDGITVSGLQLRQIAAQLQATLGYTYNVYFRSQITYS